MSSSSSLSRVGLVGLAVMGQNLALNIADKGFKISVYNRSYEKTLDTIKRAKEEKLDNKLNGYENIEEFIQSLSKPRTIIMLIKAGNPVDMTITTLLKHLEKDDMIIDGGNEWYLNTERRGIEVNKHGILYMGMGVSGGEDGARFGPSLMPGGPKEGYDRVADILVNIAAQVNDGPCVTYIGPRGAGNYVKMVHNGIEYGDMQLIAEAYDILKNLGGLTNDELANVFNEWNQGELDSFLIEITSNIFRKKDETGYIVDAILDKTGMKGTGRWTVQEAAEKSVPAPTITAALDARYLSGRKDARCIGAKLLNGPIKNTNNQINKEELINNVRDALYVSKICSYAQGMNLIREAGKENEWNLNLGEIARIWKGGCIIRAKFLDRIKKAYDRNSDLPSLLFDEDFCRELNERHNKLREIVILAVSSGISVAAFSASLAYYDAYRRERLPANLTQAQRDYFGAHTYERIDQPLGVKFHTKWQQE